MRKGLELHCTVDNHWSSIIFSDETKIELGHNDKIYVYTFSLFDLYGHALAKEPLPQRS